MEGIHPPQRHQLEVCAAEQVAIDAEENDQIETRDQVQLKVVVVISTLEPMMRQNTCSRICANAFTNAPIMDTFPLQPQVVTDDTGTRYAARRDRMAPPLITWDG